MCFFLLVLLSGAVAQDLEEAFTIFIDLNDFHVTQLGNHEFLSHEAIAEHDNVILHLSDDEVRHHQKMHDTHSCEHPAELHEVVSFIQEKMYAIPTTSSSFIDDVLRVNYGQPNLWGGQPQMPGQFAFPGGWGLPAPQIVNTAPASAAPLAPAPVTRITPAPVAATPAAAPASDPIASVAANAAATFALNKDSKAAQPSSQLSSNVQPSGVDHEEEEALARFREAYHAYKSMSRAMSGVEVPSTSAAQPTLAGLLSEISPPQAPTQAAPAPLPFGLSSPNTGLTDWSSLFGDGMDNQITQIVDDAFKRAVESRDSSAPAFDIPQVDSPVEQNEEDHRHKKHHHHKKHHDSVVDEVLAPPAQNTQTSNEFTEQDKMMLKKLLSKLTTSESMDSALRDIAGEKPAAILKADAPVKGTENVEARMEKPVASGASRPSAPLMTSHIEPAPKASDFIPENVYAQQSVPFSEPIQEVKHVAKRILIPRMEEPGPVIGGSSHPLHIQIPFDDMQSNTRPSAPSQLGISIASSITPAAEATGLQADVSVKTSSVAAANDEALTQPEVVIF